MSHEHCCNCCCRNREECLSCRSLSARSTPSTWEEVKPTGFQAFMILLLIVTFVGWIAAFILYQSGDYFIYGLGALAVEAVVYVISGLRQAYK